MAEQGEAGHQQAVQSPPPAYTTREVREAWLDGCQAARIGGVDVDTDAIRSLTDKLCETASEKRSIGPVLHENGGRVPTPQELPLLAVQAYLRCWKTHSPGFGGRGPNPRNMIANFQRVLLVLSGTLDPEKDAAARDREQQEKRERAAAAEKARRPPPKEPERPKPQLLTNEMLLGGPEKVAQLKREREENLRRKQEQADAAARAPPAKVLQ